MATVEEIISRMEQDLSELKLSDIQIPDLYTSPYIVCPTTLGNQQYFLEYYWNNRSEKAYLSIYRITNNIKEYFIKNICLIPNMFIDTYIYNTEWTGFLQFINQDGVSDISYTIKDISSKFKLLYGYSE